MTAGNSRRGWRKLGSSPGSGKGLARKCKIALMRRSAETHSGCDQEAQKAKPKGRSHFHTRPDVPEAKSAVEHCFGANVPALAMQWAWASHNHLFSHSCGAVWVLHVGCLLSQPHRFLETRFHARCCLHPNSSVAEPCLRALDAHTLLSLALLLWGSVVRHLEARLSGSVVLSLGFGLLSGSVSLALSFSLSGSVVRHLQAR